MKTITVTELKQKMDTGEEYQLIDVREEWEVEAATINGEHIPMSEIPDNLDKIAQNKPVIIHCRSGKRSGLIVEFLENNGFENVFNLTGGITAWAIEIDPSLDVQ